MGPTRDVTCTPNVLAIRAISLVVQSVFPLSRRVRVRSEMPVEAERLAIVTPPVWRTDRTLPAISPLRFCVIRVPYAIWREPRNTSPTFFLLSCISAGSGGIFYGMPTGTRPQPNAHEIALASIVRGIMATRQEPVTQTELARRTGIPQTTLSTLLKPKTGMTVRQVMLIARALGVNAGDLIAEAQRVADGTEDAHAATLRLAR